MTYLRIFKIWWNDKYSLLKQISLRVHWERKEKEYLDNNWVEFTENWL